MAQPEHSTGVMPYLSPQDGSTQRERTSALVNKILTTKNTDDFFLELRTDLRNLFEVEQFTLYAVDREKRELFSKFFLDPIGGIEEIRVPINENSVSGFCARHGKVLNIAEAYDEEELASINPRLRFDQSWDARTGFRTHQMLAAPILHERKYVMGVLLLLNKRNGAKFTNEEVSLACEIADTLGVVLRSQHQQTQRRVINKFDYLLEQHLITREELDTAFAEARRKRVDVESVLVDEYRLAKKEIGKALTSYYGCPFVEFDDRAKLDPALIEGINFDYLKANSWVPLRQDGDAVDVLVDNPRDLLKVEHIRWLMKGHTVRLCVGFRKDILQYLYKASGKHDALDSIQNILGELTGDQMVQEEERDTDSSGVSEDDGVIVRLANQIIIDAYRRGASDIHVEPYTSRQDTVVRIRIDGQCSEYQRIPPTYSRALVSRIKIMSRLDIAERRKPQDGKIRFRLPTNRLVELRVATIPTAGDNEDVVMRILTASEPIPLEQMEMNERNIQAFRNIIQRPYGLVLVVGPTGSGKTTTLHSALALINTPERKIWTAEDPVEITQYGLRQVQVHPRIGFTFAAAMRSFLRADPDVIMVGEMRDQETAHIGIEASLTGHMVFSTLHTNSAVETITRLLDMGLIPFNMADALLGVLAQRLVRTLCRACKEPYHPNEETFNEIRDAYGPDRFDKLGVTYTPNFTLYRPVGCPDCSGTGYKGRVAIHELLVNSEEIKRLIQDRARTTDILHVSQDEGMATLLQDGLQKVLRGLTDLIQVKAVTMR